MARTKGSTTKKSTEINIDEIIKKTTFEVTQKLTADFEKKLSEIESKRDIPIPNGVENKVKNKYKFIPDNTKVRIKSNIGGLFTFSEDRGKIRVFFQIDGYGQSVIINYDELRIFYSSKPSFINKGNIAIVDVYSDNDITLDDLVVDLKLDKLYNDKSKVSPIEIEDLFNDKITSDEEFERKINKSLHLQETITETAYVLYKQGLFNNFTKMSVMKQVYSKPNLFR